MTRVNLLNEQQPGVAGNGPFAPSLFVRPRRL